MNAALQAVNTALHEFAASLSIMLPRLLAALALLVVGLFVAALLKRLTQRVLGQLQRFVRRFAGSAPGRYDRWRPLGDAVVSRLVYWLVLLGFIGVALDVLGIAVFGRWVDSFLVYLPDLVAGIVIVIAGSVASVVLRDMVAHTAEAAELRHAEGIGVLAQWLVLAAALLVGASQAGIDVTLLVYLALVVTAVTLAALALAFGLATPPQLRNFIGARYLRGHYRIGDRLRLGGDEGTVVEITPYALVLETADGELHVPAQRLIDEPSLRVKSESADGQ